MAHGIHQLIPMIWRSGLLVMIGVACSTQSSVKGGDSPQDSQANSSKDPSFNKSGLEKQDRDEESAELNLPQEISGAFLTCAYVSTKESGFPESSEKTPVGCVVEDDGTKFKNDSYDLEIKLYSPSKTSEDLETRSAPSPDKWHGYANLPRTGKTKHSLGMVFTDKQSGESYGPLLFPISKLSSSSEEATLNLVGHYFSGAVNNVAENSENLGRTLQELKPDNLNTPVLPSSICSDGMLKDSVDMSEYKDIVATGGRIIGTILGGLTGKDRVPSNKLAGTGKPTKEVGCFALAKEAGPNAYNKTIRTQPVLEGAGCLFAQSEKGHVIYDRKTIEKYNIKREFLETYVLKNQCSPSQQRK